MTEWWQQPYPGKPMVAVLGFPRPLYPPDASQPHSVDGSDIVAYKRTISRAGRWPWQTFDQDFSNPFSHGKAGGQVKDSGVEGIQRQQKMQANGYVDIATFNLMRSIVIPAGLPNAGQMAMDAYSVELVNAAWNRFKGKEPPPPNKTNSAQARLTNSITQIGIKESPANSNQQKYGAWYGMNGQPWCAMFVTWCDQTSPKPSKSLVKGSKYAYVPYIVSDAQLGINRLSITSNPLPGDLVCYDWNRDGIYDHVGLFEKWTGGTSSFTAIEGNTSGSDNSNGGQVMRQNRGTNQGYRATFVRIAE